MRILVADDSITDRMVMRKILQDHGDVTLAEDGQAALDMVKAGLESGAPYDLLMLDILMPNMDGHEVLRAIRALEEERQLEPGNRLKVIMATSLAEREHMLKHFDAWDGYIVKPVHREDIQENLHLLNLV